jgi:hypothetical protein
VVLVIEAWEVVGSTFATGRTGAMGSATSMAADKAELVHMALGMAVHTLVTMWCVAKKDVRYESEATGTAVRGAGAHWEQKLEGLGGR